MSGDGVELQFFNSFLFVCFLARKVLSFRKNCETFVSSFYLDGVMNILPRQVQLIKSEAFDAP